MKTMNKNERIERALTGICETAGQLLMWMRQFEMESDQNFNSYIWDTIDKLGAIALDFKEEGLPF